MRAKAWVGFVWLLVAGWCFSPSLHAQTASQTPAVSQPKSGGDPLAVGKQALQHEQWAEAQTFFEAYTKDNPNDVEAAFYLGNAYLGLKQYPQAEEVYKKIIAQYPRTWSAHSNLSEIYAAEEKWPEFHAERTLLHKAKDNHEEGADKMGNDVIDVLWLGEERYIVWEHYPLAGRFHARYDFGHFDKQGKMDKRISCESDDVDQTFFKQKYPDKAAAGERSFSLDGYSANTHSTLLFYSEGEPAYERVRADVLRSLTGKAGPLSTTTVNGQEVQKKPDLPAGPK